MNALSPEKDQLVREFPIVNQRGLHARASAKFVQVGGTSIMGLMMLAASPGYSIRVTASGPQALQALDALEQLVASRFGEEC